MAIHRNQGKKCADPVVPVEPAKKEEVEEKLQLVVDEAKRLDAHIQDLTTILVRSHFRVL